MEKQSIKLERRLNEELGKVKLGDDAVIEVGPPGPTAVMDPQTGQVAGYAPFGWNMVIWLRNELLGKPPYGYALPSVGLDVPDDLILPKIAEFLLEAVRQVRENARTQNRADAGGDFGRSLRDNPVRFG